MATKLAQSYQDKFDKVYGKHTDRDPREVFEIAILSSKFIILITLLVVAFVNAEVSFIAESPREFLGEAMMIGGTTAAATAVIGLTRFSDTATTLNAMLVAFLVFFIFHIMMEFSGMNGLTEVDESTLTPEQVAHRKETTKNVNIAMYTIGGVVSLIALVMFPLALRVWDFKNISANKTTMSKYLIECVSFGILGGAPIYIIDKNRHLSNKEALKHSGLMIGGFSALYVALQSGGFWSHIFGEMPADNAWRRRSNLVNPFTKID